MTTTIKTRQFTIASIAESYMRRWNRSTIDHGGRRDLAVTVEGPQDGAVTVMSLREAVDSGFRYSWAA